MDEKNFSHSFMVLAYKESPYLESCVQSCVSQTRKSKVIVTTSTPSEYIDRIAKKYNVTVKINPSGGSITLDWNFAYKSSDTQYVTLAHQDDIYLPDYTKKMEEIVRRYPGNILTFSGYYEIKGERLKKFSINPFIKSIILLPFYLFRNSVRKPSRKKRMLGFGSPIPCPSVMYQKDKISDFEFSKDYKINLDWDAWIRLAGEKGDFLYVRKPLIAHRIHDASETSFGISENRRQTEDQEIFKRIWGNGVLSKMITRLYSLSYKLNK